MRQGCNALNYENLMNNFDEYEHIYIEPGLKEMKSKYTKVRRYDKIINYNSGLTAHYEESRILRENILTKILGDGNPIDIFLVEEVDKEPQLQEVMDNAIINVYSYSTHKKITLFAPSSNRLIYLYESVGEVPPEDLIKKSERNVQRGYNKIFNI